MVHISRSRTLRLFAVGALVLLLYCAAIVSSQVQLSIRLASKYCGYYWAFVVISSIIQALTIFLYIFLLQDFIRKKNVQLAKSSGFTNLNDEEEGTELPTAPTTDANGSGSSLPQARKMRSILVASAVAVAVLFNLVLFALVIGVNVFVDSTIPKQSGHIEVEGLSAPAKILREPNGVIHIVAANEDDLFFAQGFVHAQERIWQMEVNRRAAAGRLSEIVGEAGLDVDKFMRTIGMYNSTRGMIDGMSQEALHKLNSYVSGVNAYLKNHPALPMEFRLLGVSPEPWTLEDCLANGKLLAWSLSTNIGTELIRLDLLANKSMDYARIEQMLPQYSWLPTILSEADMAQSNLPTRTQQDIDTEAQLEKQLVGQIQSLIVNLRQKQQQQQQQQQQQTQKQQQQQQQRQKTGLRRLNDPFNILQARKPNTPFNSNNWVIGGGLTETSSPLLATDPHLGFSAPMIWTLIHLSTEDKQVDVIGSSLPGLPGILIGRNQNISWGITNVGSDVQDLYIMEESADRSSYLFNGSWIPYHTHTEVINVRDGNPVEIVVKRSIQGPIINDVYGIEQDIPLAFKYMSLQPNDTILEAFMHLYKAQNWNQFRDALRFFTSPSQNFVYADTAGNIGYICPGSIPTRVPGHTGKYPVPGNGSFEWQGLIPFEELPWVYNPPEQFIATTNNRVVPNTYKYTIGNDFDPGFRQQRIVNLITTTPGKRTLEDMKKFQMDQTTQVFHEFRFVFERMAAAAATTTTTATIRSNSILDENAIRWVNKLLSWDGNTAKSARSSEATLFEVWWLEYQQLSTNYTGTDNFNDAFNALFLFSTLNTTNSSEEVDPACVALGASSCQEVAERAFMQAVKRLTAAGGGDITPWGHGIHTAFFKNPILGESVLACKSNRNIGFGGSTYTLNPGPTEHYSFGSGDGSAYYDIRAEWGASYRQVVDMSDPDKNSQWIMPMGQSENILVSACYDNWLNDWLNGIYYPMMTTRDYPVKTTLTLRAVVSSK